MATQLGDVVGEADASEPCGQPRAERCPRLVLGPDCIAEDVAHLFLRAATVSTRATLELGFHVVLEMPD
jgi:hypothetical protein